MRLIDADAFERAVMFSDDEDLQDVIYRLRDFPTIEPKWFDYHTDCIWYSPEERNECPATCSQYRNGWNDAMDYICRGGEGYRPYRRGDENAVD